MGSLKRFDLNRIIKEYNTVNMFETGTFFGDGVAYALKAPFAKIISVEIISEIAIRAKSRFVNEEKVTIIEGDSVTALENVLPTIEGNCLFWLDAHFPGADAGLTQYDAVKDENMRLPLENELTIIYKYRKNYPDVLLIDDLRLFEEGNYEKGAAPADTLPKFNRNLDLIAELFGKTHTQLKSYADEGYLLLLPINKNSRGGDTVSAFFSSNE
jgi:hypothetical protein